MALVSDLQASDARTAYERFAPFYDRFTAHHNTEAWVAELLGECRRVGLVGNEALDVACGTGNSFLPLLDHGFQVSGCEISPAMLARARDKAPPGTRLRVADMRQLPRLGQFDLITCLDDAVNYLAGESELRATAAGWARNLAPTGTVLFDLNTVNTYRTFFADSITVETDHEQLRWRGHASPNFQAGDQAWATLTAHGPGGQELAPPIVHRQRHFSPTTVDRALDAHRLRLVSVSGHGLDGRLSQPLDELLHTKAIYVARWESAP